MSAITLPLAPATVPGVASPGAVLFRACLKAVAGERSVRWSSTTTGPGVSADGFPKAQVTLATESSRDVGIQRVYFREGTTAGDETVVLRGGIAYFRGSVFTLQHFNGFPRVGARRYAGVWLSVRSSEAAFSKVASGLTVVSMRSEFEMPSTPRLLPGTARVDGVAVKSLSEVVVSDHRKFLLKLLIRAAGRPLPVRETVIAVDGSSEFVASFGPWDITIAVDAPAHSVPFDTTGLGQHS